MPRIKTKIKNLLDKSKDSALLAVEIYNKPRTSFRSYGFIVLMCIAWTSLLHAIFEKKKINYFYKKSKRRYETIDGEKKAWDLSQSVGQFFTNSQSPERKNLEFFIKLRNKIEHRFVPELDGDIFGECQALLINFEQLLAQEFGDSNSINENLVFALQFSKILHENQIKIAKKKTSNDYREISKFVNRYRGKLKKEVLESLNYNFRVYLLPKVANHKNSSDFTLEFVKYDPNNSEDVKKYKDLIVAIKEKQVPAEGLTAGRIAKQIFEALKDKMPTGWKFNASTHHVRCWKYFKIRPENGSTDPSKTKSEYCFYDKTFGQYGYTSAWVEFLKTKLVNPIEYKKIMATR
jgi:hypothetical protein